MLTTEKLIYTNELDGSVELSLLSDFILETFDGRNGLQNSLITEKGIGQIGNTFISNNIDNRSITLSGKIFNDAETNKAQLVKVCNPLLKGRLKYIDVKNGVEKEILCYVNKCVVNAKSGIINFAISMTATEPYFKEAEVIKELALRINTLEFPTAISKEGIEYGLVTNKRMNVINTGDVQTPLIIEWVGVVTNPIITNTRTGEFIKVNTTIAKGEKLIIHTAYGNKKVLKVNASGTVTNAFGLIDLSSKFFDLEIGSNIISYNADSGADDSTLFIHYNNQYLGV